MCCWISNCPILIFGRKKYQWYCLTNFLFWHLRLNHKGHIAVPIQTNCSPMWWIELLLQTNFDEYKCDSVQIDKDNFFNKIRKSGPLRDIYLKVCVSSIIWKTHYITKFQRVVQFDWESPLLWRSHGFRYFTCSLLRPHSLALKCSSFSSISF